MLVIGNEEADKSKVPLASTSGAPSHTLVKTKYYQSAIISFVSRPIPFSRQKKINNAILDFIVEDLQPFSVVQDVGFKKMISVLELSYKIPNRTTFSMLLLLEQ